MNEVELIDNVCSFTNAISNLGALWVEMEVDTISPYSARIVANTGLSLRPNMEIRFGRIFYASLRMGWSCNMDFPICELLMGQEANELNAAHEVEMGFFWFRFIAEAAFHMPPFLLASDSFSWRRLDEL